MINLLPEIGEKFKNHKEKKELDHKMESKAEKINKEMDNEYYSIIEKYE